MADGTSRVVVKNGAPRAVAGLVLEHIGAVANMDRATAGVDPTIRRPHFASVPEYLLSVTKTDVVDIYLMHEQIASFARALLKLERTPARLLGSARRAGLLKRRTIIQLAWIIVRVRLRS